MKIEHIAIWCHDLDKMKSFYSKYFGAKSNSKYVNTTKQFSSYFLSFESGARIELMQRPNITKLNEETLGLAHFAFAVGSKEKVDSLTYSIVADGFEQIGETRTTGDGYYERVVLDPEKNFIEITT